MLNEDYKEILQIFLKNKVKFLVVGAYAMAAYGYPRATGDFDVWVESTLGNSKKIHKSLYEFGSPVSEITEKTFTDKGIIFQIGVSPRRIDIINHIDGVKFNNAYKNREIIEIDDMKLPFLSKKNLIKNKKSTGRKKDELDVEYLNENSNIK